MIRKIVIKSGCFLNVAQYNITQTDPSQFERGVDEKIIEVRTRHFAIKISEGLTRVTDCKRHNLSAVTNIWANEETNVEIMY
ncbi:hypothetical protein RCL_jg10418.t1 [Rhizophagus clarus]|uniref:Uncharacterized protein n=1 Tax=Rhizophagus clarus TaxID=94130 RepID=A0A8H3KV76_9GLOM|nr:hypothetical protein RCL_jg10418.t1 [Rhizophagus clarus]